MIISQYSRLSHHTITDGFTFSVPSQEDFTIKGSQSWTAYDLALSEIGVDELNSKAFIRIGNSIQEFQLIGPTGSMIIGSPSELLWIGQSVANHDKYLMRNPLTGELNVTNSGWGYDCVAYQYMSDVDRLLGVGLTGNNIDSKLHIKTNGLIAGSSSYISSGIKSEIIGASAISNHVYSGYFVGGEGFYVDNLITDKINQLNTENGFNYSTNSTIFDLWTYSIATASMIKIEADILAITDTTGVSALYGSTIGIMARDNAGNTYQVGTIDKTLKSPYYVSADISLTWSGSVISLRANGDATKSINWKWNLTYTLLDA